jgi:hypothetical protein
VECSHEFDGIFTSQRIRGLGGLLEFLGPSQDRGRALDRSCRKKRDWPIKHTTQFVEPAGANAVGAALVLLNLLKWRADCLSDFFLAQAYHVSPRSNSRVNLDIDGMGALLASARLASRGFSFAANFPMPGHGRAATSISSVVIRSAIPAVGRVLYYELMVQLLKLLVNLLESPERWIALKIGEHISCDVARDGECICYCILTLSCPRRFQRKDVSYCYHS